MAEVGRLAFACTAWAVGRAVLPPYRTAFSKHQFTPPQLLAVLCLMRYEDWTFREAEVRLREHRELRQAVGLKGVPDFTTLYRFLKRLEEPPLDRAVVASGRRLRRVGQGRSKASPGGGRCQRLGVGGGQPVLGAALASSRAKAVALEILAEGGRGDRLGPAVPVGAEGTPRPLQRRREFAGGGPEGCRADAHRTGTGRRRIRQREESHLYPAATQSTECDPG